MPANLLVSWPSECFCVGPGFIAGALERNVPRCWSPEETLSGKCAWRGLGQINVGGIAFILSRILLL